MEWSPQQDDALLAVSDWLSRPRAPQIFRLFGFAGTGKTTLAIEIAGIADGKVLFGAFTGKAALVLQRKGCAGATTIHSMIYKPPKDDDERLPGGELAFRLNPDSPVKDASLVIIDEVSMVGEELAADLLSFGTRVLVLGDPAQLPPVKGAGYFTEGHKPDVMLTEIHRQAADNPIIAMATKVRQGEALKLGTYGTSCVLPRAKFGQSVVMGADQLLVGMNKTRWSSNARIRGLKGYLDKFPMVGERLVCLKNSKDKGLLNGGLWTVSAMPENANRACIKMEVVSQDLEGFGAEVLVPVQFFMSHEQQQDFEQRQPKLARMYDQFNWGYALTCHKAQGSQWNNVAIIDESWVFKEDRWRWIYTALTRAVERVTVAVD